MSTLALNIEHLVKTYPGGKKSPPKQALKGVSLQVPQGSFYGLLGPNGAGKSTLINIIAGLVTKSSGSVQICGHDLDRAPRQARRQIGVVPQELVVDTFFTVREALDIHAGYYGVPKAQRRTDEIIAAMGLEGQADIHSRRLSGGMRRRLLIGKALVHRPQLLILDEPTAGVDVELREQLWDYARKLNREGTTVLLTTHYLEEAQELCDHLTIINHGEVVADDSKQALMRRLDYKDVTLQCQQPITQIPDSLKELDIESSLTPEGALKLRYRPSRLPIGAILEKLRTQLGDITDITTAEPELEDVFRNLTRKKAA